MGLIKSPNAPVSLTAFSMKDIENHALQILERARKKAEQFLIEAQGEGEQIKAQAKREGHDEGFGDGHAQGMAAGQQAGHQQALAEYGNQLGTLIQALSCASAEIDKSRHQMEEESGNAVVHLAVAIARKVAKSRGESSAAVLTQNVSDAARMVVRAHDVRIAIHPEQRATLLDALPAIKTKWPSLAHVEIIEDSSIAAGGCRIHTRGGLVDAELDGQIDRIAAELLPNIE
jgi:flagellar assembly protein FliH